MIERKSGSALDGHGERVFTWATLASGVSCRKEGRDRLNRIKSVEVIRDERAVVMEEVFFMPAGTDVTEDDRIVDVVYKAGGVVDAGPFAVLLVSRVDGRDGPHHVEVSVDRNRGV